MHATWHLISITVDDLYWFISLIDWKRSFSRNFFSRNGQQTACCIISLWLGRRIGTNYNQNLASQFFLQIIWVDKPTRERELRVFSCFCFQRFHFMVWPWWSSLNFVERVSTDGGWWIVFELCGTRRGRSPHEQNKTFHVSRVCPAWVARSAGRQTRWP